MFPPYIFSKSKLVVQKCILLEKGLDEDSGKQVWTHKQAREGKKHSTLGQKQGRGQQLKVQKGVSRQDNENRDDLAGNNGSRFKEVWGTFYPDVKKV